MIMSGYSCIMVLVERKNPGGKPDGEIPETVGGGCGGASLSRALAQEYMQRARICLLRPFILVRSPRICIKITAPRLYDTEAAHSPNVTSPPSTSNLRGASTRSHWLLLSVWIQTGRLWIIQRLRNDRAINSEAAYIFNRMNWKSNYLASILSSAKRERS